MAKHLVQLIALAIGAFMILETLPSSVSLVIRSIQEPGSDPLLLILASFPTLVACLVAYLYYRYASKIESPTPDIGESLLYAGAKLFGLYLFIRGISRLFIGIAFVINSESTSEIVLLNFLSAATYVAISYVLMKRTDWLLKSLGARDGA